ncbi:hypothetical protein YPPY72_2802, partial [Yersinia pestis PY-72]
MNPSYKAGSGF